MDIWGVTMVKNEQETIEAVTEHLLAQGVDHVLIADNLSTDRTPQILAEMAERWPVTVVQDLDPAYRQGEKMTRLAHLASSRGAEWVVPFDADELWFGVGASLGEVLRASGDADVLIGCWYDRVPPLLRRGRSVFESMPLRNVQPNDMTKVAFRPLSGVRLHQGNHDVDPPGLRRVPNRIVVHHYRWRSFGHFVSKNRAGKAAMDAGGDELRADWSEHWRRYGSRSTPALVATYVNLLRHHRKAGVLRDPQRPSRLAD